MIDTHIHADVRPYEDFEKMSLCMDGIITLAHDPLEPYSMDVLMAHFDRLIYDEVDRGKKTGLNVFVTLGIHPRMIPPDVNYEVLKEYLKNENVVGIGEIGLETCSKSEIKVFEEQLKISDELNLPAIIHTPRKNKEEVTREILEVIQSLNLKNKNLIIEHCNKDTVPMVYDTDYYIGLTIQPGKLTPNECIDIIKEYGGDRFLLNSDSSSAPSDVLSVPKTVLKMKLNNIDNETIKNVSHNNAVKIFNLKL